MKPINEYTLNECLESLMDITAFDLENAFNERLAQRIHYLTRWIPVSEWLPTEEDVGRRFLVWLNGIQTDACIADGVIYVWDDEVSNSGWSEYKKDDYRTAFTHWKRIDKP